MYLRFVTIFEKSYYFVKFNTQQLNGRLRLSFCKAGRVRMRVQVEFSLAFRNLHSCVIVTLKSSLNKFEFLYM